jgi:hypothetical protein
MPDQWIVSQKPSVAPFARLASIQADVPHNARSGEELGVLVGLWCDRETIEAPLAAGVKRYEIGFTVGEVAIRVEGAELSISGRYSQECFRRKVPETAKETSARDAKAGASLGIKAKFFSTIEAGADAGGGMSRGFQSGQERNGEYFHVFWRVADAGRDYWRVFGYGLNDDNVLENRILGDAPLCYVRPGANPAAIKVDVRFRCDLRDLWFGPARSEPSDPRGPGKDRHVAPLEINRTAVAAAVAALAVARRSRLQQPSESGVVELCSHRVILTRVLAGPDAAAAHD